MSQNKQKKKSQNLESKKSSKKSKVATLVALGMVLFLVFGLIASVSVPESKSVKDEVANIFALDQAKAAYILSSLYAASSEEGFTEKSIQNKLQELSQDTGSKAFTMSYDELGNITVTMDNGSVGYACANLSGYGLGDCATATLSKV
jgi:flagellar motor protein MotB